MYTLIAFLFGLLTALIFATQRLGKTIETVEAENSILRASLWRCSELLRGTQYHLRGDAYDEVDQTLHYLDELLKESP